MKRPGVNLTVLWEEYRDTYPGGYGYSRFCELYGEFEHRLSPTMRQHHVAGDKVFVDCSGKTITIVDPRTGEAWSAEIFVAVLGTSNYTYAEATWSQTLPDWIGAHVRMFQFYMGVTRRRFAGLLRALRAARAPPMDDADDRTQAPCRLDRKPGYVRSPNTTLRDDATPAPSPRNGGRLRIGTGGRGNPHHVAPATPGDRWPTNDVPSCRHAPATSPGQREGSEPGRRSARTCMLSPKRRSGSAC
jgi:hypothetical protein